MNFNNTKTALNNFADVYTRATELWKQVRHEVMTQYKEDFQHAKLSEAKEIYENTLAEARKDNMNMAEKEFDEMAAGMAAINETNKSLFVRSAIKSFCDYLKSKKENAK